MKKIVFLSCCLLLVTACSSENNANNQPKTDPQTNLDTNNATQVNEPRWVGDYKGIFPCADCEGIETELELKADQRYELSEEYLGKGSSHETKVKGTFSFDVNNPALIILDAQAQNRKFILGDNFIEARDTQTGAELDSKLNYKLMKEIP